MSLGTPCAEPLKQRCETIFNAVMKSLEFDSTSQPENRNTAPMAADGHRRKNKVTPLWCDPIVPQEVAQECADLAVQAVSPSGTLHPAPSFC